MFRRLGQLWGHKMPPQKAPSERRGANAESVQELVAGWRAESAVAEERAHEARFRRAEERFGPAATWPRLSQTLDGPRHPHSCQSCGATFPPEDLAPPVLPELSSSPPTMEEGQNLLRLIDWTPALAAWREHDDHDRPEPIVVLLCRSCSARVIEPHPRLYERLPVNASNPGVMELCVDCRFRAGVRCTHPDLLTNGGPGLRVEGATPMSVHARFKGFWWLYCTPAHSCAGRSVDG